MHAKQNHGYVLTTENNSRALFDLLQWKRGTQCDAVVGHKWWRNNSQHAMMTTEFSECADIVIGLVTLGIREEKAVGAFCAMMPSPSDKMLEHISNLEKSALTRWVSDEIADAFLATFCDTQRHAKTMANEKSFGAIRALSTQAKTGPTGMSRAAIRPVQEEVGGLLVVRGTEGSLVPMFLEVISLKIKPTRAHRHTHTHPHTDTHPHTHRYTHRHTHIHTHTHRDPYETHPQHPQTHPDTRRCPPLTHTHTHTLSESVP